MSKREKAAGVPRREEREKGWGDLTDAALALDRELSRFEEIVGAARRSPLDSHRNIERAAKTTTDAAEAQQRVSAALGALIAAISTARERHEENAAALTARGEEIRARAEQLSDLLQRYAALGEEGKSINQLVQETAARQRDAATTEELRAVVAAMDDVDGRMARLVDQARELSQAATGAGIVDLAEQADALRQQMASMRNKVGLLRRGIVARLPGDSLPN